MPTSKGGGEGIKGVVDSFFETRGLTLFTKVGGEQSQRIHVHNVSNIFEPIVETLL